MIWGDMPKSAESFGERLARLRGAAGFSQYSFAKHAEMSQSQISNYEKGRGEPTLENLKRVAVALGISVAALIGDEEPNVAPPRATTPEEMALAVLKAFGLPREKLEALESVLACDDLSLVENVPFTLRGSKPTGKNRKTGSL